MFVLNLNAQVNFPVWIYVSGVIADGANVVIRDMDSRKWERLRKTNSKSDDLPLTESRRVPSSVQSNRSFWYNPIMARVPVVFFV